QPLHSFPTRRSSDLSKRLPELPDVPTMAESGFPEPLLGAWWGMAAPKATDARIVERIATEIRSALSDANVVSRYGSLGMLPGGRSEEHTSELQSQSN